ncbi:hypothetical protein [Candidatus Pantoea multigeneris]|uniref:Uncharacterized protein n=1 Tax=Candidatus Pantoea multigeneris TaxID=2608357 RepID=A0ABX0RF42_9GAMM|nr:hypothetical protein [Pantoea multigeneris]NIF23963.1 hypothetical protein [Pantoea multigeneris]
MSANNNSWKCSACKTGCGAATNSFSSLLCIYAYLTRVPGSYKKMWLKEHSPHHRELISMNGEVIAIWRSPQNVWRKRTGNDDVEDMVVSGYETGETLILKEGEDKDDAFNLALIIP